MYQEHPEFFAGLYELPPDSAGEKTGNLRKSGRKIIYPEAQIRLAQKDLKRAEFLKNKYDLKKHPFERGETLELEPPKGA